MNRPNIKNYGLIKRLIIEFFFIQVSKRSFSSFNNTFLISFLAALIQIFTSILAPAIIVDYIHKCLADKSTIECKQLGEQLNMVILVLGVISVIANIVYPIAFKRVVLKNFVQPIVPTTTANAATQLRQLPPNPVPF